MGPGDSSAPSVVVPTFNRGQSLRRTLTALAAQTLTPSEVVVVDDLSQDVALVAQVIRDAEEILPVRYWRQKRNLGPAAARNVGVALATADVVCFTDDDCEPAPRWLENLARALESDPTLAGAGGSIESAGDSPFDGFFDHFRLLDPPLAGPDEVPMYLVTANAAYRRDWILSAGGFDEGLHHPGGEDPGLSFKVRSLGGRLIFVRDAVVRHHYPVSIASLFRMFWRYGYGGCHVAHAFASP
jgi:GT2 family glycosyltransferase